MKGISMPINAVIIIALAAIVLLVIGSFFLSGTGPSMTKIKAREVFENGCPKYACSLDTTVETTFDQKFIDACKTLYGIEPTVDEKRDNKVPVECLWYCSCGLEADKCALNCEICNLGANADKNCCTLMQMKSPECLNNGKCTKLDGTEVNCPTNK
jgi:hypothetical protein